MSSPERAELGVALIGHAFMGEVHTHAWRSAPQFFNLEPKVVPRVLVGRDADRTQAAAEHLGWQEHTTDWREAITRADVDVVDICTPGYAHAEVAIAALAAGKHVLCEKPLANTLAQAEEMAKAATEASARGVRSMVGFTYRRVPAIQLAKQLVEEGRIGTIRHVRALYLQDWLNDPASPLSWRLDKELAGSGALGDIGSHAIDLVQFITGEALESVVGSLRTFVKQRPVETESGGFTGVAGDEMGDVTVDDAATFMASLSGGGMAIFEATRFATGRKNAIRIEINGSDGSLAFDFEDMNVLHYLDARDGARASGFARIVVTEPEHPYVSAWWPPGHGLGYDHGFTHQVADFVQNITDGTDPHPSFAEGLQIQRILEAVEDSAADTSSWRSVIAPSSNEN